MNAKARHAQPLIGHRLFTDGVARPVYQDERGQFIEKDSERIEGVWWF